MWILVIVMLFNGAAIDTRLEFIGEEQCEAAKRKIAAEFATRQSPLRPVLTCVERLQPQTTPTYYIEDAPLLQDATFDEIVKRLGEKWESLEHRHKALIDPEIMKSGFYLREEDYPLITRYSAKALRKIFGH